ncbi:MAG: adenosylmethionine--8-amino-7-oxononanoate transaminase [Planctomycetota bacterium]|nr:adenosylmethionine--8-amino-7-oxononanoate transaminase [Planctomycetota bacterium]
MSELHRRDRSVVWHPYTQHGLEDTPLAVRSASGTTLVLDDGREIIDAISSWWTSLHGHGRPELVAAMRAQAEVLDHVLFAGATHEPAVALAEKLVAITPPGLARVFFSDDGSTAVEVALKIALQAHSQRGYPERRVFVAFENGYHGDTFGAMAVGDPDPFFRAFESLLFRVDRCRVDANDLERALDRLGPSAAGVIVEPLVQGAGGMRMHSIEFLRTVRELCTARKIPLIADEVMTGFGRTGAFFACEKAGISPDLMCVAKGLTGGIYPLSATLATQDLFDAFVSSERSKALFHGHSLTANPIGCAVALASIDIALCEDVPAKLERIGATIESEVRSRLSKTARVRDLRRTGGIVAFDLVLDTGGYLALDPRPLRAKAIERGVLLRPLGNVVYAMPPACATDSECVRIAEAMVAIAT